MRCALCLKFWHQPSSTLKLDVKLENTCVAIVRATVWNWPTPLIAASASAAGAQLWTRQSQALPDARRDLFLSRFSALAFLRAILYLRHIFAFWPGKKIPCAALNVWSVSISILMAFLRR
jgi:hypothetical protein